MVFRLMGSKFLGTQGAVPIRVNVRKGRHICQAPHLPPGFRVLRYAVPGTMHVIVYDRP